MKLNNRTWLEQKRIWVEELQDIYDTQEATNILQIAAEELLPHYNRLAFRDASFTLHEEDTLLLEKAMTRLKKQEPIQYILEKAWFYDITLKVNSNVLIPRPETEELVTWVLEHVTPQHQNLLDIGTGSGCIPLCIKKHRPHLAVYAIDKDLDALDLAMENAQDLQLEVDFLACDVLNAGARSVLGKFDIIVSNPPYIPLHEKSLMRTNVVAYEPDLALFVENNDPLIFYREIALFGLKNLKESGWLFFECNEYNAEEVQTIVTELGYQNVALKKDLQGKNRMLKGQIS